MKCCYLFLRNRSSQFSNYSFGRSADFDTGIQLGMVWSRRRKGIYVGTYLRVAVSKSIGRRYWSFSRDISLWSRFSEHFPTRFRESRLGVCHSFTKSKSLEKALQIFFRRGLCFYKRSHSPNQSQGLLSHYLALLYLPYLLLCHSQLHYQAFHSLFRHLLTMEFATEIDKIWLAWYSWLGFSFWWGFLFCGRTFWLPSGWKYPQSD